MSGLQAVTEESGWEVAVAVGVIGTALAETQPKILYDGLSLLGSIRGTDVNSEVSIQLLLNRLWVKPFDQCEAFKLVYFQRIEISNMILHFQVKRYWLSM